MKFAVKTLVAEEREFEVSAGMETLGDLRAAVLREFGVPVHLTWFTCSGRSYPYTDFEDAWPLDGVLYGTEEGENQERLVHLLWMRPTDFMVEGTGFLTMATEVEAKVPGGHRRGREVNLITVAEYA